MLNKISDNIGEDDLKKYFETKFNSRVEKISMSIDKPMVMFGPEIFKTGTIKSCFKIGMRNRQSRYRKVEENEFERNRAIVTDHRKPV
jgi:hypothetical protein